MEAKLKAVMGKVFGVDPATLTPESGPHTLPKWDSAAHIELVLALEKEFGVQLTEDEVVELVSFEAILAVLQKHKA